jgi:TonB family protein
MMKHFFAVGLLLLASSVLAQDQSPNEVSMPQTEQQIAAIAELSKAVQAYKAGDFAEARRHSEKALEIDPSSKVAPTFIARSIHSQYRPNVDSPENSAFAREAIAAYQRLLLLRPEDDESFKAIATLYGQLGENELQYAWILQRAMNASVPAPMRAEAYVILASKDWHCSFTITEEPQNKNVARTLRGDNVIVYTRPSEQLEFDKARQCTTRGLDKAEIAITLDKENSTAWSFKTNLLLEAAKISEMEGNIDWRDEYRQQAADSQARTQELTNKQQRESDGGDQEYRSSVISVDAEVTSGNGLEGKVISLPKPTYPPIARTARAQGDVVIQIYIDEEGKVIDAKAVSGHPLLRAAAVSAARQARFSPSFHNGQPVKVLGTITFTFAFPQDIDGEGRRVNQ